jgi:purine-nucleoside phosphorylase
MKLALVLGSGLRFELPLRERESYRYGDLFQAADTGVAGHPGQATFGVSSSGEQVAVFAGRWHLYEGHSRERVISIVRWLSERGWRRLLLTNAAGGIDPLLKVGDLMVVDSLRDFQNLGAIEDPRGLLPCLRRQANPVEIPPWLARAGLPQGRYGAMLGPNYETEAEIELLRHLGCHAVGMSTQLEVLEAQRLGMEVAAVSAITNSWSRQGKPSHEEVLAGARQAQGQLTEMLTRML